MVSDYTRPITHENYGKGEVGLKNYYHKVNKTISQAPMPVSIKEVEKGGIFTFLSDEFITKPDVSYLLPLIVGAGALLPLVLIFVFVKEKWDTPTTIFVVICCILLIFSIIYYFTKPKKEQIINRRDGLVTMQGALYQPNVTMRFKDVVFCYSTGGEDGIGSFKLQVIRPNNYTFALFSAGSADCYNDMSFFTWYMDKNRPLPPGTAFDSYRKKDFERRKTEGFPKPLYPSNIPTPEATKEQQAERERIGGW